MNPEIEIVRAQLAANPRPADLATRRARLDALGSRYSVPPDVHIEPISADGLDAEWTMTPGPDGSRVLLFLHGGGYVSGSIASHRHMVAQVGREARVRTLALGYRLAPEHPEAVSRRSRRRLSAWRRCSQPAGVADPCRPARAAATAD